MQDITTIANSLHPLERKILPYIKENTNLTEIQQKTGLNNIEALRAAQWLQNKQLITLKQQTPHHIILDKLGQEYLENKLPERRLLTALEKPLPLTQAAEKAKLNDNETKAVMGLLKAKGLITIENSPKGLILTLMPNGKKALSTQLPEEQLLKKKYPLTENTLTTQEKKTLDTLLKRKGILTKSQTTSITATLLPLGKQVLATGIEENLIDTLTPDILRSGTWKQKKFRTYDVTAQIPKLHAGKPQHYRHFLDHVRQTFTNLGFTEMTGPLVETDFWNMDALYMPQFHSARDIHDAYFLKEPRYGTIDPKKLKAVKTMHEKGGAGSTGWRYTFDEQRTRRHLLRTQGTACSAHMLASPNIKIPGKYFGITRCFRKDVIDATHLVDFNQTEGIIIEEGLTLRHLFGLLKQFAKEFAGTEQIKLVPGYFPFTEPSVELYAKHPQLGWVELGGAGMFRTEVVTPLLGKDIPVIAWGIGIDRLAMFKLGLKDIRSLFSNDLNILRTTQVNH